MRQKQTLGEKKTGNCLVCGKSIVMWRCDRKFCSPSCGWKSRNPQYWDGMSKEEIDERNRRRRERRWRQDLACKKKQESDPDAWKQRRHESYLKNKDKIVARTKRYRSEHPEVRNTEYRNSKEKYPWLRPLIGARERVTKNRGGKSLDFDLTREWCERVWTGRCAVSGIEFAHGDRSHYPFAPSIDRIDNSKGYTQDNCRFVIFSVNALKGVGTDEQMLSIAKAIVEFNRDHYNDTIV